MEAKVGPTKIAAVEYLHADAGHRTFDFLQITIDNGPGRLVGVQRIVRGKGEP